MFRTYFEALKQELAVRLKKISGRSEPNLSLVRSVFFGGGTPSLAPPEFIQELLKQVAPLEAVGQPTERTLEANPGTVTRKILEDLRAAGINRLSLGVQSFRNAELRFLGRLHDAETARKAIDCTLDAGFQNYSIDLMYGLPGQTLSDWMKSLEEAAELRPPHLSVYELTLEPGTPLARRFGVTLDDERLNTMHQWTEARLESEGYEHYETSNYARPGFRCVHNSNYWTGGEYLGIGAGAHSYLKGVRSRNFNLPTEYQEAVLREGHATEESESLTPQKAAGEALMLGLRIREGIDLCAVGRRTGTQPFEEFSDTLRELVDDGHVVLEGNRIRLSASGRLVADAVAEKFI